MKNRITGKLKGALALFVGDMLTDDSWCALGDEYPTKSVGKKQLLTLFFQTTQPSKKCRDNFHLFPLEIMLCSLKH